MELSYNPPREKRKLELKRLISIKWDSSIYFLIAINLITIFLAVIQKWDLPIMLFIYWSQSVIIGLFYFIKILNLKNFVTDDFKINRKSVEPTKETKNKTAFFFLLNYGIFHLAYLAFILSTARPYFTSIYPILIGIGLFFINHLFSFVKNFKKDTEKKQNIGRVMTTPYARIIPMHLAMIFGFFTTGLLFFLILKTFADVIMHNFEYQDWYPEEVKKNTK